MPLINKASIQAYRDLSSSIKDIRINQLIEDAEFQDVKPLLGEKFYFDVLRNSPEPGTENTTGGNTDISPDVWEALLIGGNYDHNGFTYNSPGLRRVIAEFAYARYLFFGSEVSTPFGMVEKRSQDTNSVDRARGKERYKANQQTAMSYWSDVRAFLDRKASDYENWRSCAVASPSKLKIKHIR